MVFRHTEDDGELSVFASKDQVLVACARGHYWLLDAEQHRVSPDADEGRGGDPGGRRAPGRRAIDDLSADFGPHVGPALGLG